jgi:ABC-type phosphate/phosphonate transport system substrate-binding protein
MKRINAQAWMALTVLLAMAPTAMPAEPDAIVFGIFPRWNARITVREFAPLAEMLSREINRPVRIETDKDFNSFMYRVYAREFDLVHLNQLQYVHAHEKAGYRVIAKTCDNPSCTISAIIITRRDSQLRTIVDLRHKTDFHQESSQCPAYRLQRRGRCRRCRRARASAAGDFAAHRYSSVAGAGREPSDSAFTGGSAR